MIANLLVKFEPLRRPWLCLAALGMEVCRHLFLELSPEIRIPIEAVLAYQVEVLIKEGIFFDGRVEVPVVIPFLAEAASDHELVFGLLASVELLTVAEDVEEVVGIDIRCVFIIVFLAIGGGKQAPVRHPTVAAITPKAHPHLQLKPIMRLVARKHAPETEAVRLHKATHTHQSLIVSIALHHVT